MRLSITCLLAAACGSSSSNSPDAAGTTDAAADATTCTRTPAAADRTRYVVISHPYGPNSAQANDWEVLSLSTTGTLTKTSRTFTMGRATIGEIAFTSDGKLGLAPQDDGSIGVFTLDDNGTPTVVHAKLTGSFYAHRIVMQGDQAYVLDDQWRENGGGIYRLNIGCDNTVTDGGLVVAAKLPAALAFLPNNKAALAAVDIGASPAGAEAHLLDWGATPSVKASRDAFGDDDAIISAAAVTADHGAFLIGDNSQFSGVPNRVSIVPITGDTLGTPQVITPLEDPIAIVTSPFDSRALVASGFGDALFVLAKGTSAWTKTELTYSGARPQLPGGAVMIERGSQRGLVLVSENVGVRRVEFSATGVTDRGNFVIGSGTQSIVGAIGVTP